MTDKIEFILNKISEANIKLLERDVGIPATRMYKWRDGKGKPKASDVEILWNYFQKDRELSQNGNITLQANVKPLINNESEFSDKERPNHTLGYTENSTYPTKLNTNNDEAPYLENVNVSAGLNFLTDNGSPTTYIKIPGAGVDAYINVFGDSMYPKYCAGEIIGVKQVQKEDLFFGHAFVIQMSDGEAYIKYIQPGKDDDHWSLESENPKYPPRQFHLSKISKIFKIKTTVTKNSL